VSSERVRVTYPYVLAGIVKDLDLSVIVGGSDETSPGGGREESRVQSTDFNVLIGRLPNSCGSREKERGEVRGWEGERRRREAHP
jgi:hypothetical protein